MGRSANFIIREAAITDADAICRVHIAAIGETCSGDYDAKTIAGWVANKDADKYKHAMIELGEDMFVAEVDGTIVGFASLLEDCIRALFIHPDAGRQGVGAALLSSVEEYAAGMGHASLTLSSTLTAVGFYQTHGWSAGDKVIQMSSDTPVECISMTKRLSIPNGRHAPQIIRL
jgi:putative acetyltransferase